MQRIIASIIDPIAPLACALTLSVGSRIRRPADRYGLDVLWDNNGNRTASMGTSRAGRFARKPLPAVFVAGRHGL